MVREMGLRDVNEDSYIFIYSNSEITNLETSFQLCKKPQKKKKNFTCASFPPGGFPPNKSKAGLFFQFRGARATAQPETSISAWMALSQSKPPEMEANKVNIPLFVCLFVCFGAKKAKVDEGYSSGCGCGDFAVVIVVVVFCGLMSFHLSFYPLHLLLVDRTC